MTKVVYNACFGGFSLSPKAVARAIELSPNDERWTSIDPRYGFIDYEEYGIHRHDPILVKVVEELGGSASGETAVLRIKDIGDAPAYRIEEYDGVERVIVHDSNLWIHV